MTDYQRYGRGGIRTHGDIAATLDFESSAFNRTQPPFLLLKKRLLNAWDRGFFTLQTSVNYGYVLIGSKKKPPLLTVETAIDDFCAV